jgi:hypothetical protein
VGNLLKREMKFLSRLSKRAKVCASGVIISLLSILIADSSLMFFSVVYLLGVFLIFISTFIGIEKFNENSIGETISSFALVLIMLGVFSPLGISPKFYYVQIAGAVLMLVGITLKSPKKAIDHP